MDHALKSFLIKPNVIRHRPSGSLCLHGMGLWSQVGKESANDRQTNTRDCVESECMLSGRASNFLYSRIARNQTRYNPPSYNTKGMYTSKEGRDQAAATKEIRCKASLLLSPPPGVLH